MAEAAGVSPATLDRALNQRPGVHPRCARVLGSAQRLGSLAADAAVPVRLGFVVPGGSNAFLALP